MTVAWAVQVIEAFLHESALFSGSTSTVFSGQVWVQFALHRFGSVELWWDH